MKERHGDRAAPEGGGAGRFGGHLLGRLLDRAAAVQPRLFASVVTQELSAAGGRDAVLLLQDYEQLFLSPLSHDGCASTGPQPIVGSPAGQAFVEERLVARPEADGLRVYLPLTDGGDSLGVLALSVDRLDDRERADLTRLATLVASLLTSRDRSTDLFTRARRRRPMTVAAEIQWSLLPPLTMSVPEVEVAGFLEPAYEVAGDSFDYALNGDTLHAAVIDAMGHGLKAAVMATAAIGAYRHARRAGVGLAEIYAYMDEVIADQFDPEHFATAQMMRLDVPTGRLQWVNAGHPAPLLVRDHDVVRILDGPTTLPVGFGGEKPLVSEVNLQPGDRIVCFTDGVVEEHTSGGIQFGRTQLIDIAARVGRAGNGLAATTRALSHALKAARGGRTSDDATIFLIEWRGPGR
ncbi:serine/threonine-protein phosphatase [Streptacidiphilus pinicola]|uniref:Serine/threonine-protein phosphatase n=1 Tax=Streptacidiphilus pinicola TaxID=2219663 RepID=A0A2X0J7G1_9ACTN|nr:PP2C family protein-serine/threonine phosphatase [Streptacidiphilus pinicola]RAG86196.1 serine/threonine-protein phosphatase [Streptacidiphilus pinicola]